MSRQFVLSERSARAFREKVLMSPADSGRIRRGPPAVIDTSEFPLPFTVEWNASLSSEEGEEGEESGGFMIWLPGIRLLVNDGTVIDPHEDLTAVSGKPEGWYSLADQFTLSELKDSGRIWLIYDSSSARFSAYNDAEYGEQGIPVCDLVFANPDNGSRLVKQHLASALILGGSGGGGTTCTTDNKSVDRNPDNQLEIREWHDLSVYDQSHTIAEELVEQTTGLAYDVLCRANDGTRSGVPGQIQYIPLGVLSDLVEHEIYGESGTSETNATLKNKHDLYFESGDDSNVKITVTAGAVAGDVVVKLDVYYV